MNFSLESAYYASESGNRAAAGRLRRAVCQDVIDCGERRAG